MKEMSEIQGTNERQIRAMSALAQPTRLHVFTTLVSQQPRGLSVGELAEVANTPPNTMSTHLTILARAGLVTSTKEGRVVTYCSAPPAIRDLALFLLRQCCAGCGEPSEALLRELDRCCGSAPAKSG